MFLPIHFRTKFKKDEFGELDSSDILDLIQNYLTEQGYNYIKREKNKLAFHKLNGWSSFNLKSIIVSGIIKTENKDGNMIVTNGNWLIILIAVPFLIFLLISNSKFSAISSNDLDFFWYAFLWLFGGNLILRIFSHAILCKKIETLIKENYTQLRL